VSFKFGILVSLSNDKSFVTIYLMNNVCDVQFINTVTIPRLGPVGMQCDLNLRCHLDCYTELKM
jgi:hypothetical protein